MSKAAKQARLERSVLGSRTCCASLNRDPRAHAAGNSIKRRRGNAGNEMRKDKQEAGTMSRDRLQAVAQSERTRARGRRSSHEPIQKRLGRKLLDAALDYHTRAPLNEIEMNLAWQAPSASLDGRQGRQKAGTKILSGSSAQVRCAAEIGSGSRKERQRRGSRGI